MTYLDLADSLYGTLPAYLSQRGELARLLATDHPTRKYQRRIEVTAGENARCTVIRDEREEAGIGWFGFFECPDSAAFPALWKETQSAVRSLGLTALRGPINGSIWFPYRFATQDSSVPPFSGELICRNHYHALFSSLPSATETGYYSAMREDFSGLLSITKPFEASLRSDPKLHLDSFGSAGESLLKEIFSLSRDVFRASFAYVPLSDEELLDFYSPEKLRSLFRVYVLRHEDALAGFATVWRENDSTLILKTLALAPAFQGKGIGNAMLYRIHRDAERECTRMIYALIRYENNVKRLPKDGAEVIREYAAYQIPVTSG